MPELDPLDEFADAVKGISALHERTAMDPYVETPESPPAVVDCLFSSMYPMHGEVCLRAPLIDGSAKMKARVAAITFAGNEETYSIRYADGTLLEVGAHEIEST